MNRFVKSALIGLAGLALSSSAKAQTRVLYDDFSSGSLDTSKWEESTWSRYLDEHFVSYGTYHAQQLNPDGADVFLTLNREFLPGETLEHTITYVSGSGNQQVQYMFNNSGWGGGYTWAEGCSTPSPGCNGIGHWNGDTDVGVQIGTYLRRLDFYDDSIVIKTTRPDGSSITHTAIDDGTGNLVPPYNLHIIPHTGHNGVTHFDFDDFYISNNGPVGVDNISWGKIRSSFR